ncbi:hypothetical protein MRX96_016107 [Rhipicephalus microplus]
MRRDCPRDGWLRAPRANVLPAHTSPSGRGGAFVENRWSSSNCWKDGPQGSLPKATAVAMRGGRRTMADVSRSLPALAQPPATASPSHPAAPLTASHQAAAADLGQKATEGVAPPRLEWRVERAQPANAARWATSAARRGFAGNTPSCACGSLEQGLPRPT